MGFDMLFIVKVYVGASHVTAFASGNSIEVDDQYTLLEPEAHPDA